MPAFLENSTLLVASVVLNTAEFINHKNIIINNISACSQISMFLVTYSESFPESEVWEEDVRLKNITDLATNSLAHAMSIKGDGA